MTATAQAEQDPAYCSLRRAPAFIRARFAPDEAGHLERELDSGADRARDPVARGERARRAVHAGAQGRGGQVPLRRVPRARLRDRRRRAEDVQRRRHRRAHRPSATCAWGSTTASRIRRRASSAPSSAACASSASTCPTARRSAPTSTSTSCSGWIGFVRDLEAHYDRAQPMVISRRLQRRARGQGRARPGGVGAETLFHIDARKALEQIRAWGLVDLVPAAPLGGGLLLVVGLPDAGVPKNRGLRIDHIFATEPLARRCDACWIDREARKGQKPSDHAPVVATFSG